MPLTRRSLFKGTLGAAVLATGLSYPTVWQCNSEHTGADAVDRISRWLGGQHADRECVEILTSLNRLLLDRHPDVVDPSRMMHRAIDMIDGEVVRAQDPIRLKTRLTFETAEDRIASADPEQVSRLCRGYECRKIVMVDAIADELRVMIAEAKTQGREVRFFVPIDSPGAVVDPVTYEPFYPFQTFYGTTTRPGKRSEPPVLVAKAA